MKSVLGVCILLLLIACFSPYLLPSVCLNFFGITTGGHVTAKHEKIAFYQDDQFRHVLEIEYQYVPADTQRPETGLHQVDPSTFDRLRPGSPVKVRYVPSRRLRSLHIAALGSVLADTTWGARLPHDADDSRLYFDISAIGLAILLGVLAWRYKRHAWILAAAFLGAVVMSAIVPVGFVTFPVLFAVWRKWPGKGYGLALLAAIVVFIPLLYWRVPHNPVLPPDRSGPVPATVRQLSTVHHIWSGGESDGQDIPQTFQMVDLEFTPQTAAEPVHALDRVDLDSVPGLRVGMIVPVTYSNENPRLAQMEGGTRMYREKAVAYLVKLTFLGSAVIMLILLPLLKLAGRMSHRVEGLAAAAPGRIAQQASALRADDLRRKAFEKLSKLRSDDPRRKELEELSHLSDDDLRNKILEKIPQFSPDDPRRKAIEAFFRRRGSPK